MIFLAQLVKLLDYISRYENDLTRYPTQFIRLKRYQWERMKIQWESGVDHSMWEEEAVEIDTEEKRKFPSFFRLFGSSKEDDELENTRNQDTEQEDNFSFSPNFIHKPKSIEQLRKLYMDQLFHFQLKWASSTLTDKSNVHPKYMRDSLLRSFTQQLPDSYLLFYTPILSLQKATVELDIILITPVECMCIRIVEEEDLAAFIGSTDRFWTKKIGDHESKILNPLISLDRMEKIISRLFSEKDINFPVKKYLLSRNGYIDYPASPFQVEIVDRRSYDEWFSSLRQLTTPLKFAQFQAAQAILDAGQTTAMSRLVETEEDGDRV